MRKPLIHTHCHLICCVYIKGRVPICVNAHCLMLEVLRYIALNALNTVQKIKAMSKMSKIDKVHIRGVRLCMSKMSKMGKEHTHTFWLITSLILNGFSIRKKFSKAETESFPTISSNSMYVKVCQRYRRWEKNIQTHFYHTFLNMVSFECNPMYVKDVEDRSNIPKGCNAMYVKDVEDGKRTDTHIFDIFDMLRHT